MSETIREALLTSQITFTGVTKKIVMIAVEEFNKIYNTKVEKITFSECDDGYKAYVKFSEIK